MNERKERLAEAWDERQRPGRERLVVALFLQLATALIVAAWMFVHNIGGL
jgi:hypothetical protein